MDKTGAGHGFCGLFTFLRFPAVTKRWSVNKPQKPCPAPAILFATLLAMPLMTEAANDISEVNGAIEVAANQQAGNLSTVNGQIQIGAGASVGAVDTVNGRISLDKGGSAESLKTVNGSITVEAEGRVGRSVTTVNGSITLEHNADVQGRVATVNGDIRLDGAHVGQGIQTVEGDIEVARQSRVEGGIHVEKEQTGWFSFSFWDQPPRIVIGPGAVVQGTLKFEREVKLYVSDTATIGPVEGAKVIRFSGERPKD